MGNINPEIAAFQAAVYGEDVRQAIIDLAEKLNEIVEDVVIDTDHDILVGYKNISPSDYSNLLANVNIAAVFPAEAGDWQDAPSNNAYTIINTKRSGNYNLQIAYGMIGKPNLYWRMVNRTTHEVYQEWTTDDTPIDNTLSVLGAAADAAAVGTALDEKADAAAVGTALAQRVLNTDAEIGNSLIVGTDVGYADVSIGLHSAEIGTYVLADGDNSVAVGIRARAASDNQIAIGTYNIPDAIDQYAVIVGNGDANRLHNAATVDWDGRAWFAGGVFVGGTSAADGSELATKAYVDAAIGNAIGGSY